MWGFCAQHNNTYTAPTVGIFFLLYTIYSVYQLKSVSPVLLISPLNNFISFHAHDSMRRSVRMCERGLLLTSFIRIALQLVTYLLFPFERIPLNAMRCSFNPNSKHTSFHPFFSWFSLGAVSIVVVRFYTQNAHFISFFSCVVLSSISHFC